MLTNLYRSSRNLVFSAGERAEHRYVDWLIPVGLMVLFVLYQSWPVFTEPQFYSDDQRSNWMLALRQHDPSFLSHDYAFGNPLFQGHYIPVYLFVLQTLIRYLGGFDAAMIFLHSIILVGYLLSMFILLRYITGSPWIAALVAMASALSRGSIAQEVWAATDMRAVMPRNAFLVAVPWLTLFLFQWLPAKTWWRIPLLGLLIGLATNLHPPSGLFFFQIMATLVLIFMPASLGAKVGRLVLAGLAMIIGGLPTVWAVLNGIWQSRQLVPAGTFQEFAEILHQRMRTEFPFPSEQTRFVWTSLTESQQTMVVVFYLAGMALCLGAAVWFYRQGRLKIEIKSRASTILLSWLLILNLPLAYLVSTFLALDLILVAAAYWVSRLRRQDYDRLDLWTLTILVCAGAYAFAGSAVLGWIWARFELWSLTSFYGEQARMSRLIYLPLFIFLARWLHLLWFQSRDRVISLMIVLGIVAGLAVRHWHFLDPWGPAEWGMGVSLLALSLTGIWLCSTTTGGPVVAAVALTLSFGATAYLWLYIVGVNLPWLVYLVLGSSLLVGLARAIRNQPRWSRTALVAGIALTVFGLFFGPGLSTGDESIRAPLRTQAMKALGLYDYGVPADRADSLALYDWARTQTAEAALFYYNDDQYEFRSLAVRAVTHSWKDVGGGYYTPPLAIDYYRRFQKLDGAYEEPQRLLACAQAYDADYVIIKKDQPSLTLPVAYHNELYTVYKVDSSVQSDPALCQ